LLGIAYGITGDLGAAEDVVQDAWLRLDRADEDVKDVTGWLVVATARLALDYVRSARHRREQYIGPWLPEPLVQDADPADRVTMAESVNLAMLVVLETLSPAERTVFVLHEVFGLPFGEVAEAVGRTPPAVRQLASRARKHVKHRTPRFDRDPVQQQKVVDAFAKAAVGNDIDVLLRLLDPDVVLRSDGGGIARAVRRPVVGAGKVARFLVGVNRHARTEFKTVRVNGWAGLMRFLDGQFIGVIALTVADGRVTAIDIVLNPEKLTRVQALIKGKDS
jgi:RNA polymerase sigma-70 factor (ECF subfamily)